LGPLGGVAVIVAGIVLANATIFALVRRFGRRVLDFFIEGETLSKYGFIGDRIRSVPQSKLVLSDWQNTAMLFGVLALLVLAGIILKGKLEAYVKNR